MRERASWIALVLGAVMALAGAAVFVLVEPKLEDDPLAIAAAYFDSAHTGADAVPAALELARALQSDKAAFGVLELAQIAALSTTEGLASTRATDAALDGKAVALEGGTSESSLGAIQLAASSSDQVSVYYVNGVLTTSADANASTVRFQEVFGLAAPPTLFYNHSSIEPRDYQIDNCQRAIQRYFAEHNQGALLEAMRAKAADDEAAARAGEGFLSRLGQALRSARSSARTTREAIAAGARTVSEQLLAAACFPQDFVENTGARWDALWDHIVENVDNNVQLVKQRTINTDVASSSVNDALVLRLKRDIKARRRVVLIGYSQGTLFLRNALAQVNKWYAEQYPDKCTGDGDEPVLRRASRGRAPVGALYIAPAFGIAPLPRFDEEFESDLFDQEQQRYVLLPIDVLNQGAPSQGLAVGAVKANASPAEGQRASGPFGSIKNHYLSNYLLEGTESRRLIEQKFRELNEFVRTVPGIDEPCPDSTTTTTVPTVETPPICPASSGSLRLSHTAHGDANHQVGSISCEYRDGTRSVHYLQASWVRDRSGNEGRFGCGQLDRYTAVSKERMAAVLLINGPVPGADAAISSLLRQAEARAKPC